LKDIEKTLRKHRGNIEETLRKHRGNIEKTLREHQHIRDEWQVPVHFAHFLHSLAESCPGLYTTNLAPEKTTLLFFQLVSEKLFFSTFRINKCPAIEPAEKKDTGVKHIESISAINRTTLFGKRKQGTCTEDITGAHIKHEAINTLRQKVTRANK
jgi:hypothetical protein